MSRMKVYNITLVNEVEYTFEMKIVAENEHEALELAEERIDTFLDASNAIFPMNDKISSKITNQILVSSFENK